VTTSKYPYLFLISVLVPVFSVLELQDTIHVPKSRISQEQASNKKWLLFLKNGDGGSDKYCS